MGKVQYPVFSSNFSLVLTKLPFREEDRALGYNFVEF